jgi:cytochrome c peroxidase
MREYGEAILIANEYDKKGTIEDINFILDEYRDNPEQLLIDLTYTRNKFADEDRLCRNCGEELDVDTVLEEREYAGSTCFEPQYKGRCSHCHKENIYDIE